MRKLIKNLIETLWKSLLRYVDLLFPPELSDEEVKKLFTQMLVEEECGEG